MAIAVLVPVADGATTSEPILFENVGEVISGLSYVHSVIPIDIHGLRQHAREYQSSLEKEFDPAQLERTHREFVTAIQQKANVNKTTDSLDFDRSYLSKWFEIGNTHIEEVKRLRDRIKMLEEILPVVDSTAEGPNGMFDVDSPSDDLWNKEYIKQKHQTDIARTVKPFQRRGKRHPALILAAIGVIGGAGTAFGIYNTVQITKIWEAVGIIDKKLIAFQQTFDEYSKDIIELQDEVHGMLLKQLLDTAFDTGSLVARLRTQQVILQDRIRRYFSAMQMAQIHRLSVEYLDDVTLRKIYNQAKFRARSANCVLLIRQPADLFQLEVSFSYDGKKITLMVHIPIAPPDSTLRLYKLHPFPLPFSNDTFLIPDVRDNFLGISNTNHRYTLQLSAEDLVGCHHMGKVYFCEQNGLLYKYPEDTCLGALYHQRYEDAKTLCSFHLEPAREFVRQLKDNWFLVFSENPQTIPMLCANKSYAELHIRAGASKFHLSAGCTADLPRHRLVSDMSVLIPTDYVQFEMEWDPLTFLPDLRDYVLPEFHRLQRYGQSRVALSALQTAMAQYQDSPAYWWHNVHFSGNAITVCLLSALLVMGLFRCYSSRKRQLREARGRMVEDAVRTALNANLTRQQSMLALPMVQHPTSTVVSFPPTHGESYGMMTRAPSMSNMTSVSEAQTFVPPGTPKMPPSMPLNSYPRYFSHYQMPTPEDPPPMTTTF